MIVGRGVERRRIDTLLAGACRGTSGVLVVRGDAGMGKSTLLDYAADRARGLTRLTMHGVDSEAELAFAGLTEMLRPVMADVDRLPGAQAEALQSALALRAEPANPLAVRAALLTLLATLAETTPVLVTVDDAQWVDPSSMEALGFAARRLAAERVAVLVAVRGESPAYIGAGQGRGAEVVLAGLPDDDARALLSDRAGLDGPTLEHLLRMAAGNPLALLELPDVVGAGPAPSGVEPPPVGPRVNQAFRDRLDQLPSAVRLAVGVVAADGAADAGEVLAALARLGVPADALDPAERAGLVAVAPGRVELRHPLLRSVAYHALPAPDRRRIHDAFAAVLDRAGQQERRTWHRAAAALGPEEAVAQALEEVARAAERRGAVATTAHGFERAARLSDDPDQRARRLLASADAWYASGRWRLALATLEEAVTHAVDPILRAEIAASTGQIEAYRTGPERGSEILVAGADLIEAQDPARATRLLAYAVNVTVFAADIDRARALAERAVACGERAGGVAQVSGAMARIEARLMAGEPGVEEELGPLAGLAEQLVETDLDNANHLFGMVVFADYVLERWDRADRLLELMVRRAHETGRLFMLAVAYTFRGELYVRQGRWAEAYTTVTTELWENPLDLPGVGSWLHAVQARVEAGLGLFEESQRHGEAAVAAAIETRSHSVTAFARAALGFLELSRGRPRAAVEHLEQVAATLDGGGVTEPGVLWWAADLVEAHWRLGNVGEARRRLEVFQAQAETTGRRWAHAAAARGAGLLASTDDAAEEAFATALGWHERLDAPFERARTQLCLGERRRNAGRSDADGPLEQAQRAFQRLGAEPWAAQARRLLGDDRPPAPPVELTRQERQVAALVGQGATNREAAEQLFLSPRTIDFHLRNIYKKLNVRSRTELAVHLAAAPSET